MLTTALDKRTTVAYLVKTKQIVLVFIISLVILGLLYTGALLFYSTLYQGKIFSGIYLGEMNLSNQPIFQANQVLAQTIDNYNENGLTLIYGDQGWQPTLAELGITLTAQDNIEQVYQLGREENLVTRLTNLSRTLFVDNQLYFSYNLDETTLDSYLAKLSQELNTLPQNASLIIEGGQVNAIDSQTGQSLEASKVKQEIIEALPLLEPKTVELTFVINQPIITTENIVATKETVEIMVSAPVLMSYEDGEYQVEPAEIGNWINLSEITIGAGEKVIKKVDSQVGKRILRAEADQNRIENYFQEVALGIDIEPTVEKVMKAREREDLIQEGSDGRRLDIEMASEIFDNKLLSRDDRSFVLPVDIVEKEIINEGIPDAPISEGKVIAVNLSRQLIFAYEDGEPIYFSLISTGRAGHATPTGQFKVYGKNRSAKMSGADYYLPGVPYILWYYADYSIHGTYWHDNFGHVMSHGCTNLPTPVAEWFFNWAPVGTTVINYYD